MNYIIFDLEATCWKNKKENTSEIIEIGAVKINEKKEIISTFERFVKPILNPILSDFCMELTSISQKMIEEAETFPIVMEEFKKWIGEEYVLCSWGDYDKKQFIKDCQLHGLESDWVEKHINIKRQYIDFKRFRIGVGLEKALMIEEFVLEGIHHRGIDDAKNTAKIFLKYFEKWSL